MAVTRMPDAFRSTPTELAVTPFPSPLTTPAGTQAPAVRAAVVWGRRSHAAQLTTR